jgi:hypothetical protein
MEHMRHILSEPSGTSPGWRAEGAMNLGYARVSTVEQQAGFDAQRRELCAAGVERVFEEKVSSVAERTQL